MQRIIGLIFGLLISFIVYFISAPSVVAAPPQDFQTTQIIGSGLAGPSGFDIAPDGRIFILQRTGEVKIYKNGQLLPQNFVTLPSIAEGDRGLIGITFDPNFAANKFVYFYYTGLDKRNRLVRLNATTDVGTDFHILYETSFLSEQLHVGGSIGFGPDGKLYLAVGDNGYPPNSQDLSNPHGKILRINRDGSIPVDNPFYGQPGKLPEIWAYGLRNPWRFQFDSVTGRMYDGDVGGDSWEEVNLIQKGKNYGWPYAEGVCWWANCPYTNPVYTYSHSEDGHYYSSAVTQGPIYRGNSFPETYNGRVFFGDYARGFIKTLTVDGEGNSTGVHAFDLQAGSVVDMKVAPDGSLYYITYYPGALYKVTYNPANKTPIANASSGATKGIEPFTVHFSSAGSYDPDGTPLTYSWNFGDSTISTQANPTKVYHQKGAYTVELTVSDGVNTAKAIPIVIQVGIPPQVTIGQPDDGDTYISGDQITYTAIALDAAGFDINDNDIVSEVIFHHDTHIHPFLGPLRGRSHTFTVPTTGEDSPNTWFAIHVTATDTNGLSTTETVYIYPRKSTFTLQTQPAGLQVALNGTPFTAPQSVEAVIGFQFELNVPDGQAKDGKEYVFSHWSDGGAKKHTFSTPEQNTTYTAHFVQATTTTTPIYDETLRSGWEDWSWDSTNNFNDASKPYSGVKNLKWQVNNQWAGLYFHTNQGYNTTGHHAFTLAVQATKANQTIGVQFYNQQNVPINSTFIDLTTYGGNSPVGAYKVYNIPLTDLGIANKDIYGFHIQDISGYGTNEIYIDRVGFLSQTVAIPTATPTQAVPTPTHSGPTPTTAGPTPSEQQAVIYDESIRPGWVDWTWNSTNNFNDTQKPFSGVKNLRWQSNAQWAGLYFHTDSGFNTAGYEAIRFSLQATKANQTIGVLLYDTQNKPIGAFKNLDPYGGNVPVGTYKTYTVPLSALGGTNKVVNGFHIQDITGQTTNIIYADSVMFVGTNVPTPTQAAPTPTQALPTPTPGNMNLRHNVYADEFGGGWYSWSWSSLMDFQHTAAPQAGSKAIQWKITAGYAGAYFHTDHGFSTNGYQTVTFALKATKPDQKMNVLFYDTQNKAIGALKELSAYGGNPTVGDYKVYTIPLADVSAENKIINGFHIQDASGSQTNEFYIDSVAFLGSTSQAPSQDPANKVPNSSVEVSDGNKPENWFTNSWGTNSPSFAYLASGRTGGRSVRTQITSHTSGDAKWFFKHQAVTPGKTYKFSDYYKSNITSRIVIEYIKTDGSYSYFELKNTPSSETWAVYEETFTVPADVASLTVLHVISAVGYLEIDDTSLTEI